ncbi:MAG: ferritin family protein [Rhodospirillaceae bacterium]|nr:ferritin family protein [Rhodospirillaceae bacterium]
MTITDRATLLAHAYAIESEAAERYEELASQMHTSNNHEVGDLFSKLAEIEAKHTAELSLEHGAANVTLAATDYSWGSLESPEVIPFGDVHHLMSPRQALTQALAAERRARDFYEHHAANIPEGDLRTLATEFAAEEAEHVRMVQAWLSRLDSSNDEEREDMDQPMPL